MSGIAVFGLLATPLADAGYYVLRYDKRGIGQSGGRAESATLPDSAEDVRAIVEFLRKRKDVDPKRIVLFGHGEGGLVSLLAASRDEDLAGVVLAATPSGTGGELVLEQQQYLLGKMNLPDAERATRIELQKRIQAAVLGQGTWDGVPEALKKQANTAWFQSFLGFTPATVMPKVKQPLLILHGDIDRQVPVHHADRLAELAGARKKVPADKVQLVKLAGVNHLLVAGKTGDLEEYPSLAGKGLDPRVAPAVHRLAGARGATETLRDLATEAQRARRVLGLATETLRSQSQSERTHRGAGATRWVWQMRVKCRSRICQVVRQQEPEMRDPMDPGALSSPGSCCPRSAASPPAQRVRSSTAPCPL